MLLEEGGFDIIQHNDAETALLAIKKRRPSVLITDVNLLGRMDGIELARLARQHDPDMRVVVISGRPPTGPLPDGVKFFSKPLDPTVLIREAAH